MVPGFCLCQFSPLGAQWFNHHLYIDNFYTSPIFFLLLKGCGIFAAGIGKAIHYNAMWDDFKWKTLYCGVVCFWSPSQSVSIGLNSFYNDLSPARWSAGDVTCALPDDLWPTLWPALWSSLWPCPLTCPFPAQWPFLFLVLCPVLCLTLLPALGPSWCPALCYALWHVLCPMTCPVVSVPCPVTCSLTWPVPFPVTCALHCDLCPALWCVLWPDL